MSFNKLVVLTLITSLSAISYVLSAPSASGCQTCVKTNKLKGILKQLEKLTKDVKKLIPKTQCGKTGKCGSACDSSWVLVFENDKNGNQVMGSRQELIKQVRTGASVRVLQQDSAMEADYVHIKNDHVSAQLLQTVSKTSWQNFQADSQWVWSVVSTTGTTHRVRYKVGSNAFTGEKLIKTCVKWFTKKTSCDDKPVYSHDQTGSALVGTLTDLMTSVKAGADLRGVTSGGNSAFPVQNVALTKTFVSGQTLNHVSLMIPPNQNAAKFQSNAYWWFTMYTTLGTRDMSRWTVGEHVSRGHTQDRTGIAWFSDPCWKRVYSNDQHGRATFGSRADLVTAIEKGARVRVQYPSFYTVEADNLSIRYGHVTAQVLKHVSKKDLIKMKDDAYWYWQMISTTGNVQLTRYSVGKHQNRGTTKEKHAINWFVDTKPWKLVFAHDGNGRALQGNEQQVVKAVRSGAAMRGFYGSSTSSAYAFAFQNLEINGQHVVGQHLNSVSMQTSPSSRYDVEITPNAYWWFVIFTTQGRSEMIRWSVGDHTPRGHNSNRSTLKWFANY